MLEGIALKKEAFEAIKKEMQYLGLAFIIALIIFKIAFYNEKLLILFRFVLSLFWLFVLPGYFVMLHWSANLDFIERLIIGTALAAGVIGSFSYYLGLFGLHIKYHAIVLPIAIILLSFAIMLKK